jgi:CheY-like chemotaxis protein
VVDDHDYNQLVALRIAQRIGLEPEAAQDGQEALRKLAGAAYDVLFIDWDMPDMKGTEIARHVRTLGWGSEAIIVATTAHDSDANRAECLAAGMDAFVVKPFDEATMARTLDQIRTRRGQPLNGAATTAGSGLNLRVFALVGNDDPIKTAQAAADYLSSMQQEIDHLDRAWKADAWSAAARAGHRLRAHAGLLGAEEMKNAARALQLEIESASPERRSALREALITQANALRAQIELMTGTGNELKGSPATG